MRHPDHKSENIRTNIPHIGETMQSQPMWVDKISSERPHTFGSTNQRKEHKNLRSAVVPPYWDAYLSYLSEDRELVEHIKNQLHEQGYRTWYDVEQVTPNGRIAGGMNEGLTRSPNVIVCFSNQERESQYQRVEYTSTVARRLAGEDIRLILVKVGDGRPPAVLRDERYIDVIGDWHSGMAELYAALGKPMKRQDVFLMHERGDEELTIAARERLDAVGYRVQRHVVTHQSQHDLEAAASALAANVPVVLGVGPRSADVRLHRQVISAAHHLGLADHLVLLELDRRARPIADALGLTRRVTGFDEYPVRAAHELVLLLEQAFPPLRRHR